MSPVVRRDGVGRLLAVDVPGRHERPSTIAFQHDNPAAGASWRAVADVFGE